MNPTTPSANAFRSPAYLRFFISRIGHHFSMQIMVTALSWQVWSITRDATYLAYIGLAVFLPVLLLVIPAGLASDRYDRKLILTLCMALECAAAVGLLGSENKPLFGQYLFASS
jgi:MFS family permease